MSIHDTSGYVIGLDLGQVRDFTALAVLRRRSVPTGRSINQLVDIDMNGHPYFDDLPVLESHYEAVHLERWRGRTYQAVVPVVRDLAQRVRVADHQEAMAAGVLNSVDPAIGLVVDQTGVGRSVVDTLRAAGLLMTGVTIHGGDAVSRDGDDYRTPKKDLVGNIQVLIQNRRLKIAAEMDLAPVLTAELGNFRSKTSLAGHDTYGAGEDWREGNHDDLVLAVALACWYGERSVDAGLYPASGDLAAIVDAQLGGYR